MKNLALLGAAAGVATFAGGDYLARVGPKPLRFELVRAPDQPEKLLPPLIMNDEQAAQPPPEPIGPVQELPEDFVGPILEQPVSAEPAPAPRPGTPDALLQFFTPGRNRNAVLTTPVEFSPPSASGEKSSTATYTSQ